MWLLRKIFRTKSHYYGHINKHVSKPYECVLCSKSFCYKSNLSRHMITCSGNYVEKFKSSQTVLRIKYVHVARHLRGVHHYSDIRTFVLFINKHEIGNQSYYFLYEDTLIAISVAMCEFTYFIWISCPFTINTG